MKQIVLDVDVVGVAALKAPEEIPRNGDVSKPKTNPNAPQQPNDDPL